jgi:hypothetical protein
MQSGIDLPGAARTALVKHAVYPLGVEALDPAPKRLAVDVESLQHHGIALTQYQAANRHPTERLAAVRNAANGRIQFSQSAVLCIRQYLLSSHRKIVSLRPQQDNLMT